MNIFGVLVGDVLPDPILNVSAYQVCSEFDGEFGAGYTMRLPCSDGAVGRYVIVYLPVKQFLTLCEVQVFGRRGKCLHANRLRRWKLS